MCVDTYVYKYTYIHMYIYMHACMYVYIYIYINTIIYIYICVSIYIYIFTHKRTHKGLHMVRFLVNDSAATPCRSMPCSAMRRMINSVGKLYVKGLCRLHQRLGPYRHHTSETSFCSNSSPRYVLIQVMQKTVASAFATNAVDPQTYVCLHSELNNTI